MSTLRIIAVIFGIVFIVVGILGFVPGITVGGHLLGIFSVDAMHNFVHIVSGIVALLAASKDTLSKLFFQVFGIIYGIVTVWGFLTGNVLGMQMNMPDNILHLVIAVIALYLGFFFRKVSGK